MLKAPDHQVAGHRATDGKLGPLIDDSGRFYKPLQDGERGSREVAFYRDFSTNAEIPDYIGKFFPVFYGTVMAEASDGSGLSPHLVLQDLVSGRCNPSVMDIKIGSRTWYPEASEDYIEKCLKKDRKSTSVSLGFRVSGLQVFESEESGFWKPGKKQVSNFTPEDVRLVLRNFVSSNPSVNSKSPNCSLVHSVYGGSSGILAQLLDLKAWFENQTIYHFHSCSVLMFYEKEKLLEGRASVVEIKLVDFAHVVEGKGVIDHNFLGGLCSLIKFMSDILDGSDESLAKACNLEPEKKLISTDNGHKQ
ncbi:hypothetical protein SLA2020_387490 [Shorea laevis]